MTDLTLPDRREGKVRVSYALPDRPTERLFVTTDRLSAFDRIIADVPHKGQVLNQLSAWWFEQTRSIVANHLLAVPDPVVTVARAAHPLPVEVVMRGRITGVTSTSLWQQYAAGARHIYGHDFPDGLVKNSALPEPIVTPTTKAPAGGHDEPLGVDEVVERGLVDASLWAQVCAAALALFRFGATVAAEAGLDEIAPEGKTHALRVEDGKLEELTLSAADFDLDPTPMAAIKGGAAALNASIIRAILTGERHPARTAVLMNAGAALMLAGRADGFASGARRAAEVIDRGDVGKLLDRLAT